MKFNEDNWPKGDELIDQFALAAMHLLGVQNGYYSETERAVEAYNIAAAMMRERRLRIKELQENVRVGEQPW
jgi:hypothetical protein